MRDRAEIVHENFLRRVGDGDLPQTYGTVSLAESGLTAAQFVEIFESQALSRWLDIVSRQLQGRGEGFYTIGSSGHEGNAAIAAAFRLDDMAFLHYRDAAFLIQRAAKLPGQTPLWDMLLSFTTSSEDPISGGRHKVLGSKDLFIPPQTSTIASHLPKAVGAAYSIGLNRRIKNEGVLRDDGIVLCSFGDASLNHSTAQGAINTAGWTAFQGVPLPLVFICEDNGIGISTPTPQSWVHASIESRPGVRYFQCNGLNVLDTYKVSREVEAEVRKNRKPAFLHMSCVRLYGHAGADAQHMYLSNEAIEATEAQDPLLHSARLLIENGVLSAEQVLDIYNETGERVARVAEQAITRPKMSTATEVMEPIVPPGREMPEPQTAKTMRDQMFADDAPQMDKPQHMAKLLSWTLADLMLDYPNIALAGEDIGPKGGVYAVTSKLSQRFGNHRVINTLLDEQSILGLAIGMAHNEILPIPEIQFLAYLHNAEDQLRGEAATLSFFSRGQYTNPMVLRIAGLGYQRGFGGHFHNDNSVAVLRDIPGVVIACPSNGADAVEMLRECVRLAREEQRVVVFLEPIALYMMRDLHEPKDGLWTATYSEPKKATPVRIGEIAQHGTGTELCILSYANGYYLSRQAAKALEDEHGVKLRVIDMRWLAPLPEDALLKAIKPCKHLLIVDECRRTGSVSETLAALVHEKLDSPPKTRRLAAEDSFIPLGRVATVTMPSKEQIIDEALALLGKPIKTRKSA